MPPKLYCGKKQTAPAGTVKGTTGSCYKKGVGVGAANFETHGPLAELTKDVLREYAAKLKVPRYSTMTKAELINQINDSGRYRLGIQPKNWFNVPARGEINAMV
jgi:hypothetical protein